MSITNYSYFKYVTILVKQRLEVINLKYLEDLPIWIALQDLLDGHRQRWPSLTKPLPLRVVHDQE